MVLRFQRSSSHYLAYIKDVSTNQQLGRRSKYVLIGTAMGPSLPADMLMETGRRNGCRKRGSVLHYVCSDIYKEEKISVCHSVLRISCLVKSSNQSCSRRFVPSSSPFFLSILLSLLHSTLFRLDGTDRPALPGEAVLQANKRPAQTPWCNGTHKREALTK